MYKVSITFRVQEEGREPEVNHLPSEPCDFVSGASGYQIECHTSGVEGEGESLAYAVLNYLREWLKQTQLTEGKASSHTGKVEFDFRIEEIAHKGQGHEDRELSEQLNLIVSSSSREPYQVRPKGNTIVGRGKSLPLAVLDFLQTYLAVH